VSPKLSQGLHIALTSALTIAFQTESRLEYMAPAERNRNTASSTAPFLSSCSDSRTCQVLQTHPKHCQNLQRTRAWRTQAPTQQALISADPHHFLSEDVNFV
jgi:hypothetical protein